MSEQMPPTWWSPGKGWFTEVGRETFALVPDYDGPGELPEDARQLTVAAEETGEGEGWRKERPPRRDHYMDTYRDFWADLVETDGQLDRDKVARELSDFSHVLDQYPLVLDELTNGRMSKTTYWARDIIAEVHDCQERDTEEAIAEARAEWEAEARLRSAGDGAADEKLSDGLYRRLLTERDAFRGSAEHWAAEFRAVKASVAPLSEALERAEAEVARLRSAGDGAADEDARFKELRALEANWHHDGALPVQPGMEERARAILSALRRNSPRIYPTPEGGIQLEWGHEIEVTVEPEGMSAVFGDSYLEETGE